MSELDKLLDAYRNAVKSHLHGTHVGLSAFEITRRAEVMQQARQAIVDFVEGRKKPKTTSAKKKHELGNLWFSTAEECADSAAPIFEMKRWRWNRLSGNEHIPSRAEILAALKQLKAESTAGRYISSGRLIYDGGRFGHEKP